MRLSDEIIECVRKFPGITATELLWKLKFGHRQDNISRRLTELIHQDKLYRFKIDNLWSYGALHQVK